MLNQIILVGRIANDIEIKESENGKKVSTITLAVPRNYKNINGEYETDFIKCKLWNGIAANTCEYCQKGDIVGIKGRLQNGNYEKDGKTQSFTEVIAEKVTFLSKNKSDRTQENER